MSNKSVGEVRLDLVTNQKDFNKQFNNQITSIGSSIKKLGVAFGTVFAIKKIVDFSKECAKLSNIQTEAETKLQTVMKQRMKSSTSAIESVKKLASEQQKLGIIGDEVQLYGAQQLATFLDQEKSLETLIPAMNNLAAQQKGVNATSGDLVNMGNLMGKVMQGQTGALTRVGISFSDAEEQVLKYGNEAERAAMLAQVIKNNVGDMNSELAKTPAGQIAQLKNNFGDLKETIGAGLINLFTPMLKYLNLAISKIATLANSFKAFTELITGKNANQTSSSISSIGESASDAASGIGGMGDAMGGVEKATKSAQKAINSLGIDELNTINIDDSSGGGGSSSGVAGEKVDFGNLAEGETILDQYNSKWDSIINRVKELQNLFKIGFAAGLGDFEPRLQTLKDSIQGIKTSILDISSNSELKNSVNSLMDSWVFNIARAVGSFASVGLTLSNNLIGGFNKYLEENKNFIAYKLASIFSVRAGTFDLVGDMYEALADIAKVFESPQAQQITANILAIFGNGFLNIMELAEKSGQDFIGFIVKPIVENISEIQQAFSSMLGTLEPITEGYKKLATIGLGEFVKVYDNKVSPALKRMQGVFSKVFGAVFSSYNKHVAPVIQWIGERFGKLIETNVLPMLSKIAGFFGNVFDAVATLWEYMQPFVSWLVGVALKNISNSLKNLWSIVEGLFKIITWVVGECFRVLGELMQFITGVFVGDWVRAWTAIKNVFAPIGNWFRERWNDIKRVFEPIVTWFKTMFMNAYTAVKNVFNSIGSWFNTKYTEIKNVFSSIANWFSAKFSDAYEAAKKPFVSIASWFQTKWDEIKRVFNNAGTSIGDSISSAFKKAINSCLNWVESKMNSAIRNINSVVDSVNKWSPFKISTIPTMNLPRLAQGGFVKANTPQLAMIGDNKKYGEIVAPENKMLDMIDTALKRQKSESMGNMDNGLLASIIELLKQLIVVTQDKDTNMYIDGRKLNQEMSTVNSRIGYGF